MIYLGVLEMMEHERFGEQGMYLVFFEFLGMRYFLI
jgi:hypothetical protein